MDSEYKTVSDFDRMMGALEGLPDIVSTNPSTVQITTIIGVSNLYAIQTFRQRDGEGKDAKTKDTLFLQIVSHEGTVRVVLPPEVCNVIARQRESVGTKTRKKAAKRVAQERKAAGIVPGFMRKKGGSK